MSAYLKLDSDLYFWRTTPESDDYDDLVTVYQKAAAEKYAQYDVILDHPTEDPDVLFAAISPKGVIGGVAHYDDNRLDSKLRELWPDGKNMPANFLHVTGAFSSDKRVTAAIGRSVHHAMGMTGHTYTLSATSPHSWPAWRPAGMRVMDNIPVQYPKGYTSYLVKWTFGDTTNREELVQEMNSWQQV